MVNNEKIQATATKNDAYYAKSHKNGLFKRIWSYIKYRFDHLLTHGLLFIIPFLAMITTVIVIIFSVLYYYAVGVHSYPEALWQAFTRVIDPCAAAEDEGLSRRTVSFFVILCGLVIVAILIGAIVTFMDEKIKELKKGHSTVVETNHTIILGWSSKIFDIIDELIVANESQRRPAIVILTMIEHEDIKYMIKNKIHNFKNTRIIFRHGDPTSINDINKLSPNEARSIIILASEMNHPDIRTIKTILSIRNNPRRNDTNIHVVAELKERINLEVAMIAGGEETMFVYANEIVARVIAQSCRQSGLAIILTMLLSFRYDEIYFKHENAFAGRTFYEALFAYDTCSVVGLMYSDGTVEIFPQLNTIINTDDQIIVIAEDDNKIVLSSDFLFRMGMKQSGPNHNIMPISNPNTIEASEQSQRNLILGWNDKASLVAKALDAQVAHGSDLHILTNSPEVTQFINEQLANELVTQKLVLHSGSLTNKRDLEKLDLFTFNHVIVLPNEQIEQNTTNDADAECLICLLYLRDIIDKANKEKTFSIITEMHDIRNRQLANATYVDDFIINSNLTSKYIAQLSESKNIQKVYDVLLAAGGCEIRLCFASTFVPLGTPMKFHDVVRETLKYQCLAIGYRLIKYSNDQTKFYGIVLNPEKQEHVTFSPSDKIIIIARNVISSVPPSDTNHRIIDTGI